MDRQKELEGLVMTIKGLLQMHDAYMEIDFSDPYVGDITLTGFEAYAPQISFTEK